jgi:hypothetical protein
MAYNRIQASRLLAAAELAVFEASLGDALKALTAAKLRVLIKRARTLRDKAQDLLQRQRVATRNRTGSKGGTTGAANERTAQKVRAVSEALARFEDRLARLDAAAERAAGGPGKAALASASKDQQKTAAVKTSSRISSKSAVKTAVVATQATQAHTAGHAPARSAKAAAATSRHAGTGVPSSSSGADAKGMLQKRKFTGSQAIQAHVGARGRRVQAKRDKR